MFIVSLMTLKLLRMSRTKLTLLLAILFFFTLSAHAELKKLCDSQLQEVRVEPIQIGSVAVFGELHGTQESPNFVRQVICSELSRGRRVVVGLEANLSLAADLPGADSNSISFSYEGFAGNAFWNRAPQSQDGRSSESMWSLWIDLIARQLDVGDVFVVPIQTKNTNPSIGTFVELMFQQPDTTGVILVGNYHARKGATNDLLQGLATFSELAGRVLPVRNYLMLYSTGAAWNCSTECDTHRTSMPIAMSLKKGAYLMIDANIPGMSSYLMGSVPLLREYLGLYWLDTVTPSPPRNRR